jgi:tetratricopeptide (TPR) repeat protein
MPPVPDGGGAPRPLSKEMVEGMLRAAHASLDAGRYQEAIAAYTAILKRDPRNVDAITHLGVILAIADHHAEALEAFDRALAIDPDYAHALWDKAGVQEARQDHAGAVATLERFVRVAPAGPDRDRAQERLREARARLATAPPTGAPAKRP